MLPPPKAEKCFLGIPGRGSRVPCSITVNASSENGNRHTRIRLFAALFISGIRTALQNSSSTEAKPREKPEKGGNNEGKKT